jgi:protein gp37
MNSMTVEIAKTTLRNSEEPSLFAATPIPKFVTLNAWQRLSPAEKHALLVGGGRSGFNKQTNRDIEWADQSWNPVTGCLHDCPYCYARDIAVDVYPEEVGFSPTLWLERLAAPAHHRVPQDADQKPSRKNVFVCSMADLFGRWVPAEWIEAVLATVQANPQWNFLFLTKFPKRMSEFAIPGNAWMGTTIDLQARVANAERAFEKVRAGIRWLSLEPMLEPLKFRRLELFDWVVIGGASPSRATDGSPATPAWNPPIDWLVNLHQQARSAGCKLYYKTNCGLSDMTRIREFPGAADTLPTVPKVFDYLRSIPSQEQIG